MEPGNVTEASNKEEIKPGEPKKVATDVATDAGDEGAGEVDDISKDPDYRQPEDIDASNGASEEDSVDSGDDNEDLEGDTQINSYELARQAKRAILGDSTHPCEVQFSKYRFYTIAHKS